MRRLGILVAVLAVGCASSALARGTRLPAGLVSWYQASGNARDSAGHNNGTVHGGVTYAGGHPGRGFSFDGSTGYVSIGNPNDLRDTDNFTIAAWVRFNSLASPAGSPSKPCSANDESCDMSIVSKMVDTSSGTPNTNGWRLLKQTDNHFWFCLGAGGNGCAAGSSTTARSATVARPDVWYHVVGVDSATRGLALYVNGKLQGTATGAGAENTNVAPMLLGYYPAESFLYGRLDQIQYFDRALTAKQVRSLTAGN
jgi:hypothetical protein